ncbi:hypothetical protein MPH_08939 [Macrophomina phaseolina MS6]|uniref:Uncharacterized protein n=1 Tax=Macrophomina phaseolina (strain MS6) TaxID=1126212 RepID=K2SAN0_MACPH|nr:hypothetical protein MPH_08939 [Macrophomina phaseolina MS6]
MEADGSTRPNPDTKAGPKIESRTSAWTNDIVAGEEGVTGLDSRAKLLAVGNAKISAAGDASVLQRKDGVVAVVVLQRLEEEGRKQLKQEMTVHGSEVEVAVHCVEDRSCWACERLWSKVVEWTGRLIADSEQVTMRVEEKL